MQRRFEALPGKNTPFGFSPEEALDTLREDIRQLGVNELAVFLDVAICNRRNRHQYADARDPDLEHRCVEFAGDVRPD